MTKYLILTDLREYADAYNVREFDNYNKALEFYREESCCHYAYELKFYKVTEMEMDFKEVLNNDKN